MMCRWQFQVAIGDSVPKLFLSGTILVRDSEAGVGTELAVVQKYGKQDSGTTESPAVPAGEMKLARFRVPDVENTKRGFKVSGF